MGYNRELIVPDDLNQIPSFVLVAALDDGGAMANDPMGELMKIGPSMPAKRGSFWLAVGLRGSTFVIVHVTAVVYVALDSGVEIGLIGVARMAIPSDDTALVSVELALKARYSSAEGTLSIQAQLTDNSYLLAPDCQLTGGFAYFMWFPEGQFVLTLGGYNPHFQPPTQFPNVPRLGFNWGLPIGATIKGQAYFALTNTCIMAGARLDLTWGASCANVWFTAYADFLISWDPFYYEIDIGISVGASLSITICFFGCVTIGISISIGATLTIEGPPLHGTATLDLDVCSLTVSFGPDPNPQAQLHHRLGNVCHEVSLRRRSQRQCLRGECAYWFGAAGALRRTAGARHAGQTVEADQRVLLPVRYQDALDDCHRLCLRRSG